MQIEDDLRHRSDTRATADTLVLCYHGVSSSWPAPSAIPADRLEAQLVYLLARGYRGATFTDAVLSRLPGRTLAVTFDDAYRSVVAEALPILTALGLPGTVFAVTSWIGREEPMTWPNLDRWLGTEHERELMPMSWDEARMLLDAGWEIGSHTSSHRRLPDLDDAALADELEGSRAACEEQLGTACRAVAYPFGAMNARVARAAAQAGYVAGAGLPLRLHARQTLNWPRIGVYAKDDVHRFRSKVSPTRRRLIGRPTGEAVIRAERRIRARVGRPL